MTILEIVQDQAFQKLSAQTKALYFILRAHSSEKNGGRAWPSIDTLSHEVKVKRNTVCKGIQELAAVGLITKETVQKRRGEKERINIYTIIKKPVLRSIPVDTPKKATEYPKETDGVSQIALRSIQADTETPKELLKELWPGPGAAPIMGEAAARPEDALYSEVDPREREKLRRELLNFQGRHLQDRFFEQSAFGIKIKGVT